jgi:glycosyltransferase involved in cell wall biosynthesis
MRILLATDHTHLPQRVGGAESSTHDLVLTLGETGAEVAVLAAIDVTGVLGLRNRVLRRVFRQGGFPVDHVMGYPVFRGYDPTTAAPEMLRRFRPDVVVVTSGSYAPLAQVFLDAGVPTIVYLRDVELTAWGGPLPSCSTVAYVSNSQFNATRLRAMTGIEPVVIPPLVRPQRVVTETTRSRVLFVNPVPPKGVDLVFRLAESRPDIPFEVFEGWPLLKQTRAELRRRARALPNMMWHAAVTDPRRLYRHARILLMPSMWEESWGRTVTEAHCSGIPALASSRGGLRESVGPGGILIDHEAPIERWREALAQMWDDPGVYETLSVAARRYSARPEIQPAFLVARFRELIVQYLAHCARQTMGHGKDPKPLFPAVNAQQALAPTRIEGS